MNWTLFTAKGETDCCAMNDPIIASKKSIEEIYPEVFKEYLDSNYARDSGFRPMLQTRLHVTESVQVAEFLPPGGTLLDIGTGFGIVPRIMQRLGAHAISADFPTTGGSGALQRLIDLGIEGHFLQVGIDPLPVPDESVDVVFVGNVIEHLPHSPRAFMADIKRVLKPGGHLVMDTKNAIDLKTRLKVLFGVPNWPPIRTFFHADFNAHHHKEYTLAELKQLFELAGFASIQGYPFECFFFQSLKRLGTIQAMGAPRSELSEFGEGFNFLHPYEYGRIVALLLTKLFPNLRDCIMVTGRK